MKTLDELIALLENDVHVKRFKELEQVIDQDRDLQQEYQTLLNAQKIMVNREIKKHPQFEESKNEYDKLYNQLLEHPLMSEYLDLLEILNNELKWIQEIIEMEIAKDFD